MKIEQEFVVARSPEAVWDFFNDVPRVAGCMPGAEYLGQTPDGAYRGRVSTKVGPFQTNFEGEAEIVFDQAAKQIRSIGKGVDKKGGSRGKMTILCSLVPEAGMTRVTVNADVQLSGAVAQFGRTGLLTEIAGVMIKGFVENVEAQLSTAGTAASQINAAPPTGRPPIGVIRVVFIALRNWLSSLVHTNA